MLRGILAVFIYILVFIHLFFKKGNPPINLAASSEGKQIATAIKEDLCMLSPTTYNSNSLESIAAAKQDVKCYALPDGRNLYLDQTCLQRPPGNDYIPSCANPYLYPHEEIMFNPQLADVDYPSLPRMLYDALKLTNADWRSTVFCTHNLTLSLVRCINLDKSSLFILQLKYLWLEETVPTRPCPNGCLENFGT